MELGRPVADSNTVHTGTALHAFALSCTPSPQAARHVERLAGARFAFVEVPASGLGAPANTRRVTEVDCEEAVARWMRTGNGPFTAMKPHQEAVDPQLYMHMSADEFVLVLCALYCSNR